MGMLYYRHLTRLTINLPSARRTPLGPFFFKWSGLAGPWQIVRAE